MDLFAIFRRKHKPSPESLRANESAHKSLQQATADLHRVQLGTDESKRVAARLREHNLANHYDDWLTEQFLKYYK
jgi:hypothetical protein